MKRRPFALFALLCLTVSLTIPACAVERTGFSDVPEHAAYAGAIRWAAERGYVSGYPDGRYGVDDPMTRAQMAAIFYRAAGNPNVSGTSRFSDVSATAYYVNAASWAEDNGLITGYPDGRFGVDDPVTRQQVVAILWRWAGSPNASGADYADENIIAAYAQTAVDWSRSNQILAGREDGRFAPNESATRAEVISALYQYMNLPSNNDSPASNGSRILVAYFSATNTTEGIANHVSDILNADLYEIMPEQPYTAADLNYSDSSSRTTREQNDASARPAISGSVENMGQYDVVFLGYPIWHGQAPKIISTFLESYDFTGKTIVPFCTSGSSGIGSSAVNLHPLVSDVTWLDGRRFAGDTSRSDVEDWLNSVPTLAKQDTLVFDETKEEDTMPKLKIDVNGQGFTATLLDNPTTRALLERLPMTVRMEELNGNEKYYYMSTSLPTDSQKPGNIHAGDLMLYGSDCLVLFYESFSSGYSYTRLGSIDDPSGLAAAVGRGSVNVTFQID